LNCRFAALAISTALILCSCGGDDAPVDSAVDASPDSSDGSADTAVDTTPPPMRPTSPRCNQPDPAAEPDSVPTCDTGGTGETYVYILDRLNVSLPDAEGRIHGLDLDGRTSDASDADSCFQPDATSPPPDSMPGIDAQLGLVIADLNLDDNFTEGLREGIDAATVLPLLVVENVDDLTSDECVQISLVYGRLPDGVTAPVLAADGRFEPGQTFDLRADWYEADRTTPRVHFRNGRIEGGRVTASRPDAFVEMPFPPDYVVAALPFYGVQLRFDMTAEAITGAVMGALVEPEELVEVLTPSLDEVLVDAVRAVIQDEADTELVDGFCTCATAAFVLDGVTATAGEVVD